MRLNIETVFSLFFLGKCDMGHNSGRQNSITFAYEQGNINCDMNFFYII